MPSSRLSDLNDTQREAVTTSSHTVFITGIAGTGKTEVLARRLAWLIGEKKVTPSRALVLGRSRTAGRLLTERIDTDPQRRPRPTTLRAWSVRLLRLHGSAVGMPSPFSIFDPEDVLDVLEGLMEQHGMRRSEIDLPRFRLALAQAKGAPSQGAPGSGTLVPEGVWESAPERDLYRAYEATLTRSHALDWSDVDRWVQRLLAERPELAEPLSAVVVDDAQELSQTQHAVLRHVLKAASYSAVAWSPDQRIAGRWSHPPDTIRDGLVQDEPPQDENTKWIDLPISGRTDAPIARCAAALREGTPPGNGASRRDVGPPAGRDHLDGHYTETTPVSDEAPVSNEERAARVSLDRPVILEVDSGEQEAEILSALIRRQIEDESYAYRQVAVFSRTADQAEQIARVFETSDIPYRRHYPVLGAYEPLPQLSAYLRLSINPRDRSALERVLNYPKRGIGPKTRQRLGSFARAQGIGWWEAMTRIDEATQLSSRQRRAIQSFCTLLERLGTARRGMDPKPFLEHMIEETGVAADTAKGRTHAALTRWERVLQAIDHIADYATAGPKRSIEAFIHDDAVEPLGLAPAGSLRESDENRVTVTTFPFAKDVACDVGLVTGLEEGFSPLAGMDRRALLLENERRLLYVAITRPRRRLILSWARSRLLGGDDTPRKRSRFLDAMAEANTQMLTATDILRDGTGTSENEENAYARMNPHYYRTNLRAKQADSRPDPKPVDEEINAITKDTQVSHPKFGAGTVIATDGEGERRVATIDFGPELGVKKLRLKYAKLEVIGHD